MNKTQLIVILTALLTFVALYFGCDTQPDEHKIIERQRALAAVSTDIGSLLIDAKDSLSGADAATIMALEAELNEAGTDSAKVDIYKQLSSSWYQAGKAAIAGYYAEQVAKTAETEEAWSIAGTTYSICLQQETEDKVRSYCSDHAIAALENASSINPENLQHRINLALVYVEHPPRQNPMKGILMLVELNKEYPENVSVLVQLGRLALKTGQNDKAIERLSLAVELAPDHLLANCLLGKALENTGNPEAAGPHLAKCGALNVN